MTGIAQTILGAMMKREIKRAIFVVTALLLMNAAAMAQQAAPAENQEKATPQDKKNGTGIVPPGVKLVPEMPASGAPKPFVFPRSASKTLANGLRVFVVTDSREPAIAARLVILSAGSIKDPVRMPGVAQMTANMLTQGTEKRSAREIAEAIDFVGGSLEASAGKDATNVTLNIVKKDLQAGFDLMSDVVLHPAFKADELERQRQQILSGLTVQYASPEYLASVVFNRAVYGSSPYGWPSDGTPETVKRFTSKELAEFHEANYAPNQSFLAFAGDITPEEAFATAEKYYGGWTKVDVASPQPPAPPSSSGQHIWLIDKPDSVQTQIRAGKPGIRIGDPDFIPVSVVNRIFGGGYNSRLNTEVRINKGLTYGANSSFESHRYAGAFVVDTFTRTEATVEATKLVVDLIGKMSTGEVTPEEMDFARDYLAGVYPIQSETAEQVADRVLTVAAFDLPADYNSKYPDKIRSVTPAQVRELAQRYLSTKDLDIVLAGNISAFRDDLKKAFPDAKYEEIPFEQVDVIAPDLRKPKEAAVVATPESVARGKEILLAAAKAAGGEALATVTTISMTDSGTLTEPSGELPLTVKWQVSYPNRSHGDVSMGPQKGNVSLGPEKIVQVCDGRSAWVQQGSQPHDVTPWMGEFERGISLFGGGWGIYREVIGGTLVGQFIGEESIDGKKTLGVAVQAPFGSIKLYFDSETHLLAAARYQSAGQHGPVENEQRWTDYRAVEGRQFAFSTIVSRDGGKFSESTVQDVVVNPKLDEALFSKPAGVASN
jgi:zinc protease